MLERMIGQVNTFFVFNWHTLASLLVGVTVTVSVRMVSFSRVLGTVRVLVLGHSIKVVDDSTVEIVVVVNKFFAVVTGHE